MASKISALTDPGVPLSSCFVTYIDATPSNFKATITELLKVASPDTKALITVGGNGITVNGITGDILITAQGSQFVVNGAGSGNFIVLDGVGNGAVFVDPTKSLTLQGGSAGIAMSPSTMQITRPSGGTITMDFVSSNIFDWVGAPTDLWAAINRIAARVAMGGAGPIA